MNSHWTLQQVSLDILADFVCRVSALKKFGSTWMLNSSGESRSCLRPSRRAAWLQMAALKPIKKVLVWKLGNTNIDGLYLLILACPYHLWIYIPKNSHLGWAQVKYGILWPPAFNQPFSFLGQNHVGVPGSSRHLKLAMFICSGCIAACCCAEACNRGHAKT